MLWPKPSIIKKKMKGERGCPCIMPLEVLKVSKGEPLIRIEKKYEETKDTNQLVHSTLKPNARRIISR